MLKLYNTLTKKKETFKPLEDKKVNIFVCGPTVYSYIHIGNAITFTNYDLIVKYLIYKKFKVKYIMNITDIDDRIINKANEEKVSWREISKKYENYFLEDIKELGVNSPNKYARATDYIKEIISQVQ